MTDDATILAYLVAILCTALAYFMTFEANVKALNPNNHPAEDSALPRFDERKREYEARIRSQGGVDRWSRVAANQLENFPFHLWVYWSALMAGQQNVAYVFAAYMAFRVIYVVCYVYALAPWRTVFFLFSTISTLSAGIWGTVVAIRAPQSFHLVAMLITLFFFLLNAFARTKSADPNNHPAEDANLGFTDERRREFKEAQARDGPNRWERIAVNQAETMPVSFAVYWAVYGVGLNPDICMGLFMAYGALRVLYVLCYLFALQPARTLVWASCNLLTFGTAIAGVWRAASPWDSAFFLVMACIFVLWVINFTAVVKSLDPHNHLAEDAKLGVNDEARAKHAQKMQEQGGVDRWTRIAANQLENFPVHLPLFLGIATIAGDLNVVAYGLLAYTVIRVLFIFCYLLALTPWRTLTFFFSNITIFTVIVLSVWRARDASVTAADGAWMPLHA